MPLDRIIALPKRSRSVLNSLINKHISDHDPERDNQIARLAALPQAMREIWRARSDILTFLRTGDEELAYHLRRRFGLGAPLGIAYPIPSDIFGVPNLPAVRSPATIIVPVFNGADAFARLVKNLPPTLSPDQSVIVVDDGSFDPRIPDLLERLRHDVPKCLLISRPRNCGFVDAVNTGIEQADPAHHVVVLNSDTLPPMNWVPRLLAPIADTPDVASVTPLSNSAEIISIPRPWVTSHLSPELVAAVDLLASRITRPPKDLPTGIGYCMAMNRTFIDRIGGFDPAFGRGYGEEVDWSLRAAAAGGRNVVATNLFVGHEGHASFGASERATRIARSSRKIARRHPTYAADALAWEARDPIGPERLAISLAWAAASTVRPIAIFVAHSLGGGAEMALEQEIAGRFATSSDPLVILRVGGPALWRIELRGPRFSVAGDVSEDTLLGELLKPLTRRVVIYSCAVWARNAADLPNTLLQLANGHRLELRIHDYFIISPSWTLLGRDGRYSGIPELDCSDPAHAFKASNIDKKLSHREWRNNWGRVVSKAASITAFSASSAALIEEAFPEAHEKITVSPHRMLTRPRPLAPGGNSIGVLGGINRAKGGAVLTRLAHISTRPIAVIGKLDGRFTLQPPHRVHGSYATREISSLAEVYDVGLWFIPSIWPETFSFATHEALATGLPVACFDLGAQAEAARAAPNGHVLSASPDETSAINAELSEIFHHNR